MRAEVGRLSRNITVQAPESAEETGFGFHTMIMPNSGPVNVQGTEFIRGGQLGTEGRYTFHWHRNPDMEHVFGNRDWQREAVDRSGDWIRNSSMHNGFQRGVVLHGVNNVVVDSNFVYDTFSHGFTFSEDGHEIGNELTNNLTMTIKRADRDDFSFPRDDHTLSSQAEHRPSGFWGRNPFNVLTGNHAAGTIQGNGFFYDSRLLSHDMKRLITREHIQTESVVFENNLSHSNYRENVRGGGNPTYGPTTRAHGLMVGTYINKVDAVFGGFQTYKNSVSGAWIEDDNHTIRDAIMTDASAGSILFRSTIEDTVIVGQSDNQLGGEPQALGNRKLVGGGVHFQPHLKGMSPNLSDVTFVNQDAGAVVMWKDPFRGENNTATFENITLINTDAIYQHRGRDVFGSFADLDGSLTGTGVPTIVSGTELNEASRYVPEWQTFLNYEGSIDDLVRPQSGTEVFAHEDVNVQSEEDVVEVAHQQELELQSGAIAFSFVSETAPDARNSQTLFSKRAFRNDAWNISSYVKRGRLYVHLDGPERGDEVELSALTTIEQGQLYDVQFEFDADEVRLFLNSRLVDAKRGIGFELSSNRESLLIGGNDWNRRSGRSASNIRDVFHGSILNFKIMDLS